MSFVVEERAAKWPFGPFAAGDHELLRRELLPPLGIRLDDLGHLDGTDKLGPAVIHFAFHCLLLLYPTASNGPQGAGSRFTRRHHRPATRPRNAAFTRLASPAGLLGS